MVECHANRCEGVGGTIGARLRVIGLRRSQKRLQTEQGCFQGQRWAPLVLQDVQADGAVGAADVGVPDPAAEAHARRHERVLVACTCGATLKEGNVGPRRVVVSSDCDQIPSCMRSPGERTQLDVNDEDASLIWCVTRPCRKPMRRLRLRGWQNLS